MGRSSRCGRPNGAKTKAKTKAKTNKTGPRRNGAVDRPACAAQAVGVRQHTEEALIDEVQRRLARKYDQVPPDDVAAAVQRAQARFAGCPVRDFIPLLVERRAKQELFLRNAAAMPA